MILCFISSAKQTFPYVKKRIQVVYVQVQELNPIQVAIDELKAKVNEMKETLSVDKPDMKRLQLQLQGSVSVTVSWIETSTLVCNYLKVHFCYPQPHPPPPPPPPSTIFLKKKVKFVQTGCPRLESLTNAVDCA